MALEQHIFQHIIPEFVGSSAFLRARYPTLPRKWRIMILTRFLEDVYYDATRLDI